MSKYLKKREKKHFSLSLRPLCAFAVWLVLFSLMSTGITYGKYQAQATAKATANVAKFSVTASGSADVNNAYNIMELLPGGSGTYTLTVTNNSDVAIQNTITISGVPSDVTVELDGVSKSPDAYGVVVFNVDTTVSAANPTAETAEYVLEFIASSEAASNESTVSISVRADQA